MKNFYSFCRFCSISGFSSSAFLTFFAVLIFCGTTEAQTVVDMGTTAGTAAAGRGNYITAADGNIYTGIATDKVLRITTNNAKITLRDLDINNSLDEAIRVNATGVVITLEGVNSLQGGIGSAGLRVSSNYSVTIQGSGSLTTRGGMGRRLIGAPSGAGIGGGYLSELGTNSNNNSLAANANCGTVTINGGVIKAYGGALGQSDQGGTQRGSGAGIGGGGNGNGCTLTINGGTVEAYHGRNGLPGIAAGTSGNNATLGTAGTTVIDGGSVQGSVSVTTTVTRGPNNNNTQNCPADCANTQSISNGNLNITGTVANGRECIMGYNGTDNTASYLPLGSTTRIDVGRLRTTKCGWVDVVSNPIQGDVRNSRNVALTQRTFTLENDALGNPQSGALVNNCEFRSARDTNSTISIKCGTPPIANATPVIYGNNQMRTDSKGSVYLWLPNTYDPGTGATSKYGYIETPNGSYQRNTSNGNWRDPIKAIPQSAITYTGTEGANAFVGHAITATIAPTYVYAFDYQWYNGSGKITGATSASYTPNAADFNSQVYLEVTPKDNTGSPELVGPPTDGQSFSVGVKILPGATTINPELGTIGGDPITNRITIAPIDILPNIGSYTSANAPTVTPPPPANENVQFRYIWTAKMENPEGKNWINSSGSTVNTGPIILSLPSALKNETFAFNLVSLLVEQFASLGNNPTGDITINLEVVDATPPKVNTISVVSSFDVGEAFGDTKLPLAGAVRVEFTKEVKIAANTDIGYAPRIIISNSNGEIVETWSAESCSDVSETGYTVLECGYTAGNIYQGQPYTITVLGFKDNADADLTTSDQSNSKTLTAVVQPSLTIPAYNAANFVIGSALTATVNYTANDGGTITSLKYYTQTLASTNADPNGNTNSACSWDGAAAASTVVSPAATNNSLNITVPAPADFGKWFRVVARPEGTNHITSNAAAGIIGKEVCGEWRRIGVTVKLAGVTKNEGAVTTDPVVKIAGNPIAVGETAVLVKQEVVEISVNALDKVDWELKGNGQADQENKLLFNLDVSNLGEALTANENKISIDAFISDADPPALAEGNDKHQVLATNLSTWNYIGKSSAPGDVAKAAVAVRTVDGVPQTPKIKVVFDEAMNNTKKGIVKIGAVALDTAGKGVWSESVPSSGKYDTYTIEYGDLATSLISGREYTVTVSGFYDKNNNKMLYDEYLLFTTGTKPEVSVSYEGNVTEVGVNNSVTAVQGSYVANDGGPSQDDEYEYYWEYSPQKTSTGTKITSTEGTISGDDDKTFTPKPILYGQYARAVVTPKGKLLDGTPTAGEWVRVGVKLYMDPADGDISREVAFPDYQVTLSAKLDGGRVLTGWDIDPEGLGDFSPSDSKVYYKFPQDGSDLIALFGDKTQITFEPITTDNVGPSVVRATITALPESGNNPAVIDINNAPNVIPNGTVTVTFDEEIGTKGSFNIGNTTINGNSITCIKISEGDDAGKGVCTAAYSDLTLGIAYKIFITGFRDVPEGGTGEGTMGNTKSFDFTVAKSPTFAIVEAAYGAAVVGEQISAPGLGAYADNVNGKNPAKLPLAHIYQWYSTGDISLGGAGNATSAYTPANSDFGKLIYAKVTPVGKFLNGNSQNISDKTAEVGVRLIGKGPSTGTGANYGQVHFGANSAATEQNAVLLQSGIASAWSIPVAGHKIVGWRYEFRNAANGEGTIIETAKEAELKANSSGAISITELPEGTLSVLVYPITAPATPPTATATLATVSEKGVRVPDENAVDAQNVVYATTAAKDSIILSFGEFAMSEASKAKITINPAPILTADTASYWGTEDAGTKGKYVIKYSNLTPQTTYSILIQELTDENDNSMNPFSFSFTTAKAAEFLPVSYPETAIIAVGNPINVAGVAGQEGGAEYNANGGAVSRPATTYLWRVSGTANGAAAVNAAGDGYNTLSYTPSASDFGKYVRFAELSGTDTVARGEWIRIGVKLIAGAIDISKASGTPTPYISIAGADKEASELGVIVYGATSFEIKNYGTNNRVSEVKTQVGSEDAKTWQTNPSGFYYNYTPSSPEENITFTASLVESALPTVSSITVSKFNSSTGVPEGSTESGVSQVSPATDLVIAFNKNIVKSGSITIKSGSSSISINEDDWTVSGNEITISNAKFNVLPNELYQNGGFVNGTSFNVEIEDIEDALGNKMNAPYFFTFTTKYLPSIAAVQFEQSIGTPVGAYAVIHEVLINSAVLNFNDVDGISAGTHEYSWKTKISSNGDCSVNDGWTEVATTAAYTPQPSDFGKYLCVTVTPKNAYSSESYSGLAKSSAPVQIGVVVMGADIAANGATGGSAGKIYINNAASAISYGSAIDLTYTKNVGTDKISDWTDGSAGGAFSGDPTNEYAPPVLPLGDITISATLTQGVLPIASLDGANSPISTDNIVIKFTKEVSAIAGKTVTVSDGTTDFVYTLLGSELPSAANSITIPVGSFEDGSSNLLNIQQSVTYTVTLYEGAFEDSHGNATAGGEIGKFTAAGTFAADITPISQNFAAVDYGYSPIVAQVFTLTNKGGRLSETLSASIKTSSDADCSDFVITTELSATTLEVDGTATISVKPKDGLNAGIYSCLLKITSSQVSATAALSFTVNKLNYAVDYAAFSGDYDGQAHGITVNSISPSGTLTYSSQAGGPYNATPLSYTDAGTHAVYLKIAGDANHNEYAGMANIVVDAKSIASGFSIAGVEDLIYNRFDQTFDNLAICKNLDYTASIGEDPDACANPLIAGTDYVVTYSNNRSASESASEKAPTVSITGRGNYAGVLNKKFTIEQAELITIPILKITATYGETLDDVVGKLSALNSSVTGVGGETVPLTWTFVEDLATLVNVEGTLTPTAAHAKTPTENPNYKTILNQNVAITVNKKPLTVADPTIPSKDKVYDGTSGFLGSVTPGSLSGVLASDNGEVSVALGQAYYENKNAGNNKKITVEYSVEGAKAGNYDVSISNYETTGNISKRELTLSSSVDFAVSKEYDRNVVADASEVTGGVILSGVANYDADGGMTMNVSEVRYEFEDANVGESKNIRVNGVTFGGTEIANYSLPNLPLTVSGKGEITAATLALIEDLTATAIYGDKRGDGTYGINTSSFPITIRGVGGEIVSVVWEYANGSENDLVGTPTAGAPSTNFSVKFIPQSDNYDSFNVPLYLTVVKKQLTVETPSLLTTKEYDGSIEVTGTVDVGEIVLSSIVEGDNISKSNIIATAEYETASVGKGKKVYVNYAVSEEWKDLYFAPARDLVVGEITKKTLTLEDFDIAINNDQTRYYNAKGNVNVNLKVKSAAESPSIANNEKVVFENDITGIYDNFNAGEGKVITVSLTGKTLGGDNAGNYALPLSLSISQYKGEALKIEKAKFDPAVLAATLQYGESYSLAKQQTQPEGWAGKSMKNNAIGESIIGSWSLNASATVNGSIGAETVTEGAVFTHGNSNYESPFYNDVALTVTKRKIELDAYPSFTLQKAYDGTPTVLNLSIGKIKNIVGAENVEITAVARYISLVPGKADADAGLGKMIEVSYNAPTGTNALNYEKPDPYTVSTGSIIPATVTLKGFEAITRSYISGDKNAPVNEDNIYLTEVADADKGDLFANSKIHLVKSVAKYEFANDNAGTNKPITITGWSIAGTEIAKGNYNAGLVYDTLSGNIDRASIWDLYPCLKTLNECLDSIAEKLGLSFTAVYGDKLGSSLIPSNWVSTLGGLFGNGQDTTKGRWSFDDNGSVVGNVTKGTPRIVYASFDHTNTNYLPVEGLPAKMTVDPKQLSASAVTIDRNYDKTDTVGLRLTLSGVVESDVNDAKVVAKGKMDDPNAGNRKIVNILPTDIAWASGVSAQTKSNYILPLPNNITPEELTVNIRKVAWDGERPDPVPQPKEFTYDTTLYSRLANIDFAGDGWSWLISTYPIANPNDQNYNPQDKPFIDARYTAIYTPQDPTLALNYYPDTTIVSLTIHKRSEDNSIVKDSMFSVCSENFATVMIEPGDAGAQVYYKGALAKDTSFSSSWLNAKTFEVNNLAYGENIVSYDVQAQAYGNDNRKGYSRTFTRFLPFGKVTEWIRGKTISVYLDTTDDGIKDFARKHNFVSYRWYAGDSLVGEGRNLAVLINDPNIGDYSVVLRDSNGNEYASCKENGGNPDIVPNLPNVKPNLAGMAYGTRMVAGGSVLELKPNTVARIYTVNGKLLETHIDKKTIRIPNEFGVYVLKLEESK